MTKAVFIVGGSGYLGTHLALRLRETYKVFATYHSHRMTIPGVTFVPSNLGNKNWVKRVVYTAQPEVIIYVAGSNSLEKAERDPRMADFIHTGGVATVANASDIFQPKLIYLSNCFTFDGNKGNYREGDTVLPNSVLGKAKLAGENYVRGKSLNHILVRSSPVFGRANGSHFSFLDTMRMSLDRGLKTELSRREIHSFAPVDGLVEVVARLIDSSLKNKIIHYGGLTKMTHYEFGLAFAKRFGYDPRLVVPVSAAQRQSSSGHTQAESQYDYSLNSTMAIENLKIKSLLLEESFDLIEKKLIARS